METLLKSTRRIQSVRWLIKLRWVAIIVLGLGVFFAKNAMKVALPEKKLYFITGVLLLYNFILFIYIRQLTRSGLEPATKTISKMIMFQIFADLFILTTILHFSGGIENPFCFFFVFHMIIGSILCKQHSSYIQAAAAIFLFSLIVFLEYLGKIHHYELEGFAAHRLYKDFTFISGTLLVFSSTLILVVYMTNSIMEQLREQEESVELANQKLQEKDKIKNEYVLRVTHDIKGHLAAIESCINPVQSEMIGPLNDKQKDLVGRAYQRTHKCISFVAALLKITRLNLSGQLEAEHFHLNKIISIAITTVQNRANEKKINLSYEGNENVADISGEKVLLEETLTNLLFNAVRYTPSGGRIVLTLEDKQAEYLIQIKDSGIGIPIGEEEKIFEEFHRADNARKVERDGTGLGLSFARQVIEKHGGKIWAQNNPEGGSTFSFTLPKNNT